MRVSRFLVACALVGGCHGGAGNGGAASGTTGTLGGGGTFTAPTDSGTVDHGPPLAAGKITVYGKGNDFHDVSTDSGGGVWGVTSAAAYYFVDGKVHTYDQDNGLARGQRSWNDAYWCQGSTPCPTTNPVIFSSVAGGNPGQAFVGNIGYTGDRLDVDPQTGAVIDVVGMQVTATQQGNTEELSAQQEREVATWKGIVDLNGPTNGRAYFGGFHGLSALDGMSQPMASRLCGVDCWQYEQHIHPFRGDKVLGRDIHALALTADGDVWVGDADAIWFLPQRSRGAGSDFFQAPAIPGQPSASSLDVFPGVDDDVYGIGADGAGGVWVASYGNGLAYLAPNGYAPSYFTTATGLPQNKLTSLAIDADGAVWIGTNSAGAARYTPSSQKWDYVTTATGLPSNDVRAVYADRDGHAVWFATDDGIAVYKP